MDQVEGKVAFVTGGGSGIGLAMARSFVSAGMKVVVADIEEKALKAVDEEFRGSNAELITLGVDVTDRDAMEQAAIATEEAFGRVHVLCNNAGVAVGGDIGEMSYTDWDWVMNVNLHGVINGLVTFVNRIKAHGEGGHIVNTASMAGQMAIGRMGVYNATKFAVVGLSESMRHDLEPANIGVSVLCPGFVATNIFTSGRNRPANLASSRGPDTLGGPDMDEIASAVQQSNAEFLEPRIVGEMVLQAIQGNDMFIFTHPQFKDAVIERGNRLNEAFDRWAEWRASNPD